MPQMKMKLVEPAAAWAEPPFDHRRMNLPSTAEFAIFRLPRPQVEGAAAAAAEEPALPSAEEP